jgi:hypothetical protein
LIGKEMLGKSQDQNVAENSVALQIGGSADKVSLNQTNNTQNVSTQTNNYSITVEEVRSIVSDAFKAEAYKFLDHAGDIATARAQKLCDAVLARLESENPAALNQARDPDFRYALLTAQKAYARNDDQDTGALLVELLVERTREEGQNLAQVVLNEALDIVPRLTKAQIAALTIAFISRRTVNFEVENFAAFLGIMDQQIASYVQNAKLSQAAFSHMAFTGCGQLLPWGGTNLADLFLEKYPGIWQAGFNPNDPALEKLSYETRVKALRPSYHSSGMVEVFDAPNGRGKLIREQLINDDAQRAELESLLVRNKLSPQEVKERCIAARPYMSALFELWDDTDMKKFDISAIGSAIAHANIIRILPGFGSISIWIN